MAKLTLKELAGIMKHIDICMMTTMTKGNAHTSRPMSNNRQVDYDGDSYFFTDGKTPLVKDITNHPQVNLAYTGHHSMINRKSVYISVEGKARLIKDKKQFEDHWNKDVEVWFKDGIDTPGLTLIHVQGSHLKYWDGMEEGEISLKSASKSTKAKSVKKSATVKKSAAGKHLKNTKKK